MQARLSEAENRPLLTIAIPTYNRSSLLSQLLDSLREQIAGDPRVHLLISDNASTDDTVRVVEEERRCGTRLDYIRNTENIGAERNFLQCYEQAATKYLWIISDDDLLCSGTVPRVLDYLSEDEYEIVFIAPGGFFSDRPLERPTGYPEKALVCTDS
ncbi:MAG TPA: glycosyltransferase, partial [Terracidiphilus sp.]